MKAEGQMQRQENAKWQGVLGEGVLAWRGWSGLPISGEELGQEAWGQLWEANSWLPPLTKAPICQSLHSYNSPCVSETLFLLLYLRLGVALAPKITSPQELYYSLLVPLTLTHLSTLLVYLILLESSMPSDSCRDHCLNSTSEG